MYYMAVRDFKRGDIFPEGGTNFSRKYCPEVQYFLGKLSRGTFMEGGTYYTGYTHTRTFAVAEAISATRVCHTIIIEASIFRCN